jgi:FMN-dependent NADH-azoreductase
MPERHGGARIKVLAEKPPANYQGNKQAACLASISQNKKRLTQLELMKTILHLDSSGRDEGSLSRKHSALLTQKLATASGAQVLHRDLGKGIPFVDEMMIGGYFTPEDQRTAEQREALKVSDALVAELRAANEVVIGLPIYNFGVPAAFKAWADLIARLGVTFAFGETGPVGLLADRPVHVVVAYGGTEIGSERDFATPWLRLFFAFVGITNLTFHAAPDLEAAAK